MAIPLTRLHGFFTEPALRDEEIHRVAGILDRVKEPPHRSELTVVTWNIAYGRRADRVLDVLERMSPDVCLLQEVDVGCRRSGFLDLPAWLAERLAMNWVFGGEFQEIGEGRRGRAALTGQAILSRAPIHRPAVIPFSGQARFRWRANPIQPRRGARMALHAETFGLRVYNLHVESGKNDRFRRRQVDDVVVADAERARDAGVVVAGDFNCGPFGHAPLLERLQAHGFDDPFDDHPGTRRTCIRHRHALDWIFLRDLSPVFAAVGDHRDASDHLPLIVRVRSRASSSARRASSA